MLNVDLKLLSKPFSEKVIKVLPDLIPSQQTTYVKNKHIREGGRLLSGIIEMTKTKKTHFFSYNRH